MMTYYGKRWRRRIRGGAWTGLDASWPIVDGLMADDGTE
jgi:hypothetical protein